MAVSFRPLPSAPAGETKPTQWVRFQSATWVRITLTLTPHPYPDPTGYRIAGATLRRLSALYLGSWLNPSVLPATIGHRPARSQVDLTRTHPYSRLSKKPLMRVQTYQLRTALANGYLQPAANFCTCLASKSELNCSSCIGSFAAGSNVSANPRWVDFMRSVLSARFPDSLTVVARRPFTAAALVNRLACNSIGSSVSISR